LFLAGKAVVMLGIVVFVLNSPAFVLAGLANWAWWPGAVLALVNSLASGRSWIMGNILLARRVWDSLAISELVDTTWVSTLAATTSTAVDNNLSIKSNWSWVLVFGHNVESISKRRCGTLSPA